MFHPNSFAYITISSAAPALLVFSLLFSSCAGGATGGGDESGPGRSYEVKGVVVSVDRAKKEAVLDHEEIPGYMAAMRMPFPVKDADALGAMEAGDLVRATMVVTDLGYRLENVSITKGGGAPPPESAGAEPQAGGEAPNVTLVNQDNRPVRLRGRDGAARVVTFIYTRCPLPDQCPLMSANFAAVNEAVAGDPALRDRVRLLSVTLDPEFDKPEVLREYGAGYAGGGPEAFARWDFATGDPADVRRLAEFLGLSYREDSGQIIHSLRTAVLTPDGKLHKLYRGNEWRPSEVVRDLRALLN
jgi:protein SCO1